MKILYKNLISNYIEKLKYEDVKKYIYKEYKEIDEKEIKVIYKYIKTRWLEIYNEEKEVFEDLKKEVSSKTYQEIMKLLKLVRPYKR